MTWAKNLPVSNEQIVSFPLPTDSWSSWKRRLTVGAIAGLVIVAMLVGAWHYFRLGALDDYRTGYALGSVFESDGQRVDKCGVAMERLYVYGSSLSQREPGWGEFLVGCEDGVRGEVPIAWHGLRDRLWPSGGD